MPYSEARHPMVASNDYLLLSVREIAQRVAENDVRAALARFSCSRDHSIERFVRTEAIEFAEELYGTTYIFLDKESWLKGELTILGIFTLAIATADFGGLSKSQHKKVFGHKSHGKTGPHRGAWLLGQFARADGVNSDVLSGKEMYSWVLQKLRRLREGSSGRALILECVPDLVPLYESYDFKVLPVDDSDKRLVTMYAIPEPKRSLLYSACA